MLADFLAVEQGNRLENVAKRAVATDLKKEKKREETACDVKNKINLYLFQMVKSKA